MSSRAEVEVRWLARDGAEPGALLERALRELPAIAGDTFHWIATESRRARAMRQWLDQRGVPKDWIKATGYWQADADDDAA